MATGIHVLIVVRDSIAYERIGVLMLSAGLKSRGHKVSLVVAGHHKPDELFQTICEMKPDVIGYTTMTGEHLALVKLNTKLKSAFSFVSVFGGAHPTFFPHMLEEEIGVDAICIGEGDEAFPEFCSRLSEGAKYWLTPSFHVRHEGQIYRNNVQALVADMDELPLPDREILYGADPELARVGTKHFMTARGCPYQCTYCFNSSYNEIFKDKGKILRVHSPRRVIEEIRWVKDRYPLDHVYFIDDLFLLKPNGWLEEFAMRFKRDLGIPFSCTIRANVVKDETIKMLKDAGLKFVWMGVECGDEMVANKLLKRGLTNDHIIKAARVLKDNDVQLITQNLVGLPVEDAYATDLRTLDLNIAIRPEFGWSSILYPYPGTGIEESARHSGHLSGPLPYLETNKKASALKFSSLMEKRKIENLHKLFGIIVQFPLLRRHVDFLCMLPLTSFYHILYYLWYGYCLKFKLSPIRSYKTDLPIFTKVFFRMLAKT